MHNIFQFFITALKGAILTKNGEDGENGENGESPKILPERWENLNEIRRGPPHKVARLTNMVNRAKMGNLAIICHEVAKNSN